MVTALATGLLCGIWSFLAPLFNLFTWAGFAGCTTFFAIGEGGLATVKKAMLCNVTGVACGMLIIWLSEILPFPYSGAVFSGLITVVMCLLGILSLINYTPGIFVGCFTTFAANGQAFILIISLLCGALLGFLCDELGKFFLKWQEKYGKTIVPGKEKNVV